MTSLLLLVRNLLVARLIPVEDYGIAATFAVVMAMVEMASAFGLQQQIVQSKDGDDPRFQAALQAFQVLRGVAAGLVLFLIAGPIARFLGIPEVIWAYQLLALVPVIKAFEHFDIHRLNRQMRFWPMILTGTVPALLSLLLVWPLAAWLGDWRVLLYAILVHMGLTVILSHLMAERPYRLVFDRSIMGGSLRFGWPILANSVLLFLVFQGDKLIVGRVLGMEALAIFAMGMTLTLMPTQFITQSARNFFLPQLSNAVGSSVFIEIASRVLQIITASALLFLAVIFLFGGPISHILLGSQYEPLVPLLVWFGIGQAIRLIKVGPAIVALSIGYTSNAMIANSIRVAFLPAAWFVAEHSGSVLNILWLAIIAETIGVFLSLYLLSIRSDMPFSSVFFPQIIGVLACVLLAFWIVSYPADAGWPSPGKWVSSLLMLGGVLTLMFVVRSMILLKYHAKRLRR